MNQIIDCAHRSIFVLYKTIQSIEIYDTMELKYNGYKSKSIRMEPIASLGCLFVLFDFDSVDTVGQ